MRKFGFSFSWKRAIGLSAAKGKLSRKIGIPLTRTGRQQKVGRTTGCLLPLFFYFLLMALTVSARWLPLIPIERVKDESDAHPIIGHYVIGQRASHQRAKSRATAGLT